jgi:ferredoxin-NADP reductase
MSEVARTVTVEQKLEVADGVVVLVLRPTDGDELPAWASGAHVDLRLPGDLVRQYSLCGDPADRSSYRVAVLHEPAGRGGSVVVHDVVRAGDTLALTGPRNHFALVDAARYLFIAGGIGITPILPMLAEVDRRGSAWQLVYGGRQRRSMAFLDELSCYGDAVRVHPQDEYGLLDLAGILGTPRPDTVVYCCGPEALLRAVETWCEAWPDGALHLERFAAKPMAAPLSEETFEVEIASSGERFAVLPGVSILKSLESHGLTVLSSCQEGTCGTCETGVLAGVPDHRDSVLTRAEQEAGDIMMICVSRSRTPRLVLDL